VKAVRGEAGQPVLVDVDEVPGEGELLSMRSVGICASDLMYLGYGTERILGHELAGVRSDGTAVVVEGLYGCGSCEHCLDGEYNLCAQATQQALGIFNDGGMVEQFRAPANRLVELPAGLDVRSGALVEPASVAWHGVRIGGAEPGRRVLVVGGGSVGLLAVAAAQAMGAEEVGLEARHPHQKEIGERLGATTPNGEYEVVIEAAGSASALQRSLELLAPGGTVSMLGLHMDGLDVSYPVMLNKEARVIASMGYCTHDGGRDMQQAAELLAGRPEIAEAIITHRFPLADAAEAFRVAADRQAGAVKVVVELG
jgi:2-desacetyl-2-hydroxyethyl bacteriochlorophyllide A dehydrogenase